MNQFFIYKEITVMIDGKRVTDDWIMIFQPEQGEFSHSYPGQPTRTYHGTVEMLRRHWLACMNSGWTDKATCKCGKEIPAEDYIHLGQCRACEEKAETGWNDLQQEMQELKDDERDIPKLYKCDDCKKEVEEPLCHMNNQDLCGWCLHDYCGRMEYAATGFCNKSG